MDLRGGIEFYVAVAAVTASLLAGVSGLQPPADNVVVEVKLEKELHIISRNATANESDSEVQSFECVMVGLSKDELSLFTVGKTHNVMISSNSGNQSGIQDLNANGGQSQPFNVELNVVNDTLVVKGDILMKRKSNETELEDSKTTCEVVFLDSSEESSERQSSENATSRHLDEEAQCPEITSQYDHIVLMNGAPEQVISCTARGNPSPRINWIVQDYNARGVETLSKQAGSHPIGETVSYLMFSQVNESNTGNFTCVAENKHGRAIKTFEVEVITVDAISLRCNEITDDGPSTPSSQPLIYKQNIQEILHRSKRHLWYQWRSTKIYPPPSSSDDSELQKMINLIAERLKLADKVAVNKWDNNLPVEDVPREKIILDNMVRQAQQRGLNPAWAHRFFRDQIEGNKDIQYELLRTWQIQGRRPYGPPVDLANEVRPEIDRINGQLIDLAKYTENERKEWKCRTEVEKNARYSAFLYNFDSMHQKALQRATENVCIVHVSGRSPFPFHPYPPVGFPYL